MNRTPVSLAVILAAACAAPAEEPARGGTEAREGVGVTVYSDPAGYDPDQGGGVQRFFDPMTGRWEQRAPGFSVVKERRRLSLRPGVNDLRYEEVAANIDAATVHFRSLTDPEGTSVVEQGFEYDLASADRILEKFVGRGIEVIREGGMHRGTLLSFNAATVVLRLEDGRTVILGRDQASRSITLPDLPGGLVTKPTLVWKVAAAKGGDHLAEVAYETSGMSWAADYTAVISPDETKVDLSAWVTIRNQSGASYPDAALKLVAGDLNRVPRTADGGGRYRGPMGELDLDGRPPGFAQKAFFEYHLYTLGRRTDLPDRSLKQIELFDPVAGVPVRKVYLYDGTRGLPPGYASRPNMDQGFGATGNRKVGVFLELDNREENGMGMPLPAGRVRVYKRDEADGFPELIGEDRLDHTPKDEKVRLKVGDAFDLVGERRQTHFRVDRGAEWMEESFEIRVRNHKEVPVEVIVAERMYRWVNWEITEKSHEFVKKDSRRVHFPVRVEKDGEAVVTYTVNYTW